MGQTRRFAEQMNLASMTPAQGIASTTFCLANPGKEYLAFVPQGVSVTVDLSPVKGELNIEWFDIENDKTMTADNILGGDKREIRVPFAGAAVLYLFKNP